MATVTAIFQDQPDGSVRILMAMDDPSPKSPALLAANTIIAMATANKQDDGCGFTQGIDLRVMAEPSEAVH